MGQGLETVTLHPKGGTSFVQIVELVSYYYIVFMCIYVGMCMGVQKG